jgi:RecA/RadA recombinase
MATKQSQTSSKSSILERLKAASTIKESAILKDSKFFETEKLTTTQVRALNLALSGSFDGGFGCGLITIAGPSKHFKTCFTLLMLKAYFDTYEDAVAIWYDSEFGSPQSYFNTFGIDTSRILHVPLTNIEELKFDIVKQLEAISRGDRVFIGFDSAGNLASKKEVEDAMDGKSTADMTRAKQMKSLFRMITPHLKIKQIPMVVVNHTYKTQEMYSKDVVSGGTGIYYSSDIIFIIGRQQEKEGTEVAGYNFIINVEKSRFVREKSKIPVQVMHNSGIARYSGMLDIAHDAGFVTKPKVGWYSRIDDDGVVEEKLWRAADTETEDFWKPLLASKKFNDKISEMYTLGTGEIMTSETIDAEIAALEALGDE